MGRQDRRDILRRTDRNSPASPIGDAINPVFAAVGYNFPRLLKWLEIWLAKILALIFAAPIH
jgi:hypothetical protein